MNSYIEIADKRLHRGNASLTDEDCGACKYVLAISGSFLGIQKYLEGNNR